MSKTSLRDLVSRAHESMRLDAHGLGRLQRDLMRDGVASREEADLLIALDRAVEDKAEGWADWFVATLVDFVVWTSRPTGYVDADTARWLVASLSRGGATANGIRIAGEIAEEAEAADEALFGLAGCVPLERARSAGRGFDQPMRHAA